MDIKNNLEDYYEIIGKKLVDQKSISKSINYLLKSNIDYEFRTTLVGEYHDFKNIEKIADMEA